MPAAATAAKAAGPEGVAVSEAVKLAAKKKAQQGAKKSGRAGSRALSKGGKDEKIIKAEWLTGIVLMWIYPIVKPQFARSFNNWVARMMMWTVVYIALLLVSGMGPRAARVASAFGGLTVLMLLLAPFSNGAAFGMVISDRSADAMRGKPKENTIPPFNGEDWINQLLDTSPQTHTNVPPGTAPPPLPLTPN